MLSNATYDLMETAAVISKGLYRYPRFQQDAKDCQHCQKIWNDMKQIDERQLEILVPHLREHLDRESAAKAA